MGTQCRQTEIEIVFEGRKSAREEESRCLWNLIFCVARLILRLSSPRFSIASDVSFCIRMEPKDFIFVSTQVNVLHLDCVSSASCAVWEAESYL